MWLKLSESVVLTREILNAGIGFVRALSRPSSPGRYDSFPSTMRSNQNTLFRIGHQAMILKPYALAVAIHPLLWLVYSPFHFGVPFE